MKRTLVAMALTFVFLTNTTLVFAEAPPTKPNARLSLNKQLESYQKLAQERIAEATRLQIFEKAKEIATIENVHGFRVNQNFRFVYYEKTIVDEAAGALQAEFIEIDYNSGALNNLVFSATKTKTGLEIKVYKPGEWVNLLDALRKTAKKKQTEQEIEDLKKRYGLQ